MNEYGASKKKPMTVEEMECNCVFAENLPEKSKRKHNGQYTLPHYFRYTDMIKRCYKPHCKHYASYGGRGILVCFQWLDVFKFNNDINDGYAKGLSLERIDNNKGYCPHNTRWASKLTQALNRRKSSSSCIRKHKNGFQVFVKAGAKQIHIGSYNNYKEAKISRDEICREWYGESWFSNLDAVEECLNG